MYYSGMKVRAYLAAGTLNLWVLWESAVFDTQKRFIGFGIIGVGDRWGLAR